MTKKRSEIFSMKETFNKICEQEKRRRNFKVGDNPFHIYHRKHVFEVCKVEIKKILAEGYLVKIPNVDGNFIALEDELFLAPRGIAKAKQFFENESSN